MVSMKRMSSKWMATKKIKNKVTEISVESKYLNYNLSTFWMGFSLVFYLKKKSPLFVCSCITIFHIRFHSQIVLFLLPYSFLVSNRKMLSAVACFTRIECFDLTENSSTNLFVVHLLLYISVHCFLFLNSIRLFVLSGFDKKRKNLRAESADICCVTHVSRSEK